MSASLPKRFYKDVTVRPSEGGWQTLLDGRPVKTPGKLPLTCPSEDVAGLIADEWDAQDKEINPSTMPLTRLLSVAIERTPDQREELVAEARRYAGSDVLCYRATQPSDLRARQDKLWTPWLDWASDRGITLEATDSIVAIAQEDAALEKVADYARGLDDLRLTLYVHMISVLGSAILAMAVMEGGLEAGEAFEISRLDAIFQIEIWGEDEEAKERADHIRNELLALAQII